MKKYLLAFLLLLPLAASATTAVPWLQTNLTDAFFNPAKVNGINLGLFVSGASSTLQALTFTNATGTQATTTGFAATTICFTGDTCRTTWPSVGTSYTASYPIILTGTAFSLGFGTTTANSWSLLNNFNLASSTVLSVGNAFFGATATSSFNGVGDLFVTGSTTLQNFTASKATTTQATTTNFAISGLSSNGFVKTYGSTGNLSIDTNTYLTSVSADAPLGGSGTSGSHLTCTGCLTTMTFSYPFPLATNGTSTLVGLFGGLLTSATSTIGGGGNTTGLTISGGATTTGTFLHLASTTMQNFTGSIGTTTNFFVGQGNASSSIAVAEYAYGASGNLATSTTMTIDARTANQILWPIGTSATTLTLCNFSAGRHLVVKVQNPDSGTAGTVTWAVCSGQVLYWPAQGATPTQTTTAKHWDIWSFDASGNTGTSTASIIISGAITSF